MKSHFLVKSAGLLGSALIHSWMGNMDYKVAYHDSNIDPAYPNDGRRRIYVFWHEHILIPLYLRRHCNLTMLLSKHRDADILEQAAGIFGFDCVRGSTYGGGIQAIRKMMDAANQQNLTITPDGPRGPRRELAQGAIYLASRLQFPLVLLGMGVNKPWRLNSWDKFVIPKPYSRIRIVVSGDIIVPQNADRATLEHFRIKVQGLLSDLCDTADVWAESDNFVQGESMVEAGPNHSLFYRSKPRQVSG